MGFFRKLKRIALPTIGAVLGSALLPGAGTALGASIGSTGGAAIGGGLGTLASGGSIKDALLSGVGTYAGSTLGGQLFGPTGSLGNIGSIGEALGASNVGPQFFGAVPGTTISAALANAPIGSVLGGFAGSHYAANSMRGDQPKPQASAVPTGPEPFKPKQEGEQDLPSGLTSSLGSLTPQQRSTNIATQGVYGGGAGPKETSYFLNQANRRLVDEGGNVSANTGSFAPIELSFLNQLGFGTGNPSNILEAISKWRTQNPAYA